jgi:transcription antitermination factor NusG
MTKCLNNPTWNVIYTCPKTEKKVHNSLTKLNVDSYLPLQKVVRQWSDRKKKIEVPMFPNYVFVKVDLTEHWKVLSVNGVVRFINFAGILSKVPDYEIDMIKRILQDEHITVAKENCCFEVGRKIRIAKGRFTGLVGTLIEKRGKFRLLVRIESISQSIAIDIPTDCIEDIFV